ncbi:unnamed protein product, partial [Prorocentrum cordatum]
DADSFQTSSQHALAMAAAPLPPGLPAPRGNSTDWMTSGLATPPGTGSPIVQPALRLEGVDSSEPPQEDDMGMEGGDTDLTQDLEAAHLTPNAQAPPPVAPQLPPRQTQVQRTFDFDPDAQLRETYVKLIEDAALASFDVLAVRRARGLDFTPPSFDALLQATTAAPLRALLYSVAFDPDAHDAYERLGLARVEDRVTLGIELLSVGTAKCLDREAQDQIDGWRRRLQEAAASCALDLPDALAARRAIKGEPKSLDACGEVDVDFTRYLHDTLDAAHSTAVLALHMSNILRTDLAQFPCAATVSDTRHLQAQLCGAQDAIEQLFRQLSSSHLVTWAPSNLGQVQKVALAWRSTTGGRQSLEQLSLRILPGCQTASQVDDLWDRPLLHPKWRDVVKEIRYLTPPVSMVITSRTAPVHQQRHIAIIILGSPAAPAQLLLEQWRPASYEHQSQLVWDPAAMLLDATSPKAALHYQELYKDALVLSAKLLLISTRADSARPDVHTGERIRNRQSRDGPETYAQVTATASQLNAARARGGHAAAPGNPAKPVSLQATVHIPLGTTGPPEDWLPAALSRATAQQGLPTLRRADDDSVLGMHELCPIRDAEGGWMGKIVIQLAAEAEVRKLHEAIHGMRLAVNGHDASVEAGVD